MDEPDLRALMDRIHGAGSGIVGLLRECRAGGFEELWRRDSRLFSAFGRELIRTGHPTLAFEVAQEGLRTHGEADEPELQYLRALALARGGSIRKASSFVGTLLGREDLPPCLRVEALGLAGRLLKDRYARSRDDARRRELARESARLYEAAAALTDDAYPAVNAASMHRLAGDEEASLRLAREAERRANALDGGTAIDSWRAATLAEACLLQGKSEDAAAWYRLAVRAASGRFGDIASMKRNAALLAGPLAIEPAFFEVFGFGRVVAFAGHMIDRPDRARRLGLPPRFPSDPALEEAVRARISKALDELDATVGFASAACGSDILFAEEMLARKAELHLVLPFDRGDFFLTSVDFGDPDRAAWRRRAETVLAACTAVHFSTGEHFLGDENLFLFANRFTQGMSALRARGLGLEPAALAVLDGETPGGAHGTGAFVSAWEAQGWTCRRIDLAGLCTGVAAVAAAGEGGGAEEAPHAGGTPSLTILRERRVVKAMLFADVKNFSKLREEQTPLFFYTFLDEVADVLERADPKPEYRNTWGDGLYLVFDTVRACADFALRLIERIEGIDFARAGLPADLTVRIGMHTGPVYRRMDPVLGREGFFGSHVSRAARIEPVTMPGCAFASEQFAALLTLEGDGDFVCEYMGVEDLAKGYDRAPLYQVLRA